MDWNVAATLHGIVRGRTIELTGHPALHDGCEVEVIIRQTQLPQPWGDTLRRCAVVLETDWNMSDDRMLFERRDS